MGTPRKLTQKDIKQFKEILVSLRKKLSEEVGQIEGDYLHKNPKDSSGDLSGYSFHMADMATDSFDTEFNIGLAENSQNMIKAVDIALKKIEEGTYGVCEKYNTPISKARLKAMPFARYSLKAQEEEEKQKKRRK